MPLRKRFIRVLGVTAILRLYLRLHPASLGAEHEMRMLGRHGQIAIDRRSERMDQIRPVRIPQPQRTGADSTEVSATVTDLDLSAFGIDETRLVDTQMLAPFDRQGSIVATQIDGIAPPPAVLRQIEQ
ncbi:hypothetical protein A3710_11940 [Stutzerimonas frequens]|nr:hypothetical protein A3710_11940 [Stutzerimonas frequens]